MSNRYFGSIVAVGLGEEPPAEHSFVSARCKPADADLIAVSGEGVVQTVSALPDGKSRFELILRIREPVPEEVVHWVVTEWKSITHLSENYAGS